jgi:serine/threonine protein kinase
MSGNQPFRAKTKADLYKKIRIGMPSYEEPIWSALSKEGKNFVVKCLNVEASKRPSAEELLKDEWFKKQANSNIKMDDSVKSSIISNIKSYQ